MAQQDPCANAVNSILPDSSDEPMATQHAGESKVHGVPVEIDPINFTERQGSAKNHVLPKQNVGVFATEPDRTNSSPASSHEPKLEHSKNRQWKTVLFRLGPLSGVVSLVLAFVSILVALGVLLGSNDVPAEEWTVEPSAILAICTAVVNQAVRYAAFQGLMIAWWYGGNICPYLKCSLVPY